MADMKKQDRINDSSLESVAGGNGAAVQNPLLSMLDMYYQIAMEENDPAKKRRPSECTTGRWTR